ncbi:MAG: hypothetical protein IPO88_18330 [Nannocystis sp.]|uniref:hypothetical protein n=1 Tax=Nannocystis sp. TaxID=1962667 RepID=UPI002425F3BB|nr:hypothetical protein [Nannocystis sp.]MBK9755424.1 hypothetical protein [Nannocystis sp.]
MPRPHACEVDVEEAGWRLEADGELRRFEAAGYAPATAGDWWFYATRQGPGPELRSWERVVSARWQGEDWVARVRSEHVDNPAANSERSMVVTPAGVSPDIGVMDTAIGPVRTLATQGVFLPRQLTPGSRWRWQQRLGSPLAMIEVEGTGEAIAEETVVVPAGRFTAMLVRGEICSRVTMHEPAGAPVIEHRQRDEGHHVRGLGLVAHRTLGASGQELVKLLLEYSVRGSPAASCSR